MDKKVSEYIEKQKFPQKGICKKLRKIILKALPGVKEEMKWGVPCYGNGKYYFVGLKDHVNIGFCIKGLTKKELGLLEGSGKTMRHIKIASLKDIEERKIIKLLRAVKK